MATPLDELFVAIETRQEKLDKGLRQVEGKVKKSAQKLEKASNFQFGGGVVQGAAKVLAVMGSIELAVKGVDVAVAALDGDLSGALEVAKSLPAGIGPVVAGVEALVNRLSGATAELKRLREEAATRGLETEIALLGVRDPDERARQASIRKEGDAIKAIQLQVKEGQKSEELAAKEIHLLRVRGLKERENLARSIRDREKAEEQKALDESERKRLQANESRMRLQKKLADQRAALAKFNEEQESRRSEILRKAQEAVNRETARFAAGNVPSFKQVDFSRIAPGGGVPDRREQENHDNLKKIADLAQQQLNALNERTAPGVVS